MLHSVSAFPHRGALLFELRKNRKSLPKVSALVWKGEGTKEKREFREAAEAVFAGRLCALRRAGRKQSFSESLILAQNERW